MKGRKGKSKVSRSKQPRCSKYYKVSARYIYYPTHMERGDGRKTFFPPSIWNGRIWHNCACYFRKNRDLIEVWVKVRRKKLEPKQLELDL